MKMYLRPFEVHVYDRMEVRMGVPYYACSIELKGTNIITLPENLLWQDKFAWSNDNRILVLISLNLKDNVPGFHLFIIETISGKIMKLIAYLVI